MPRDSRTSGDTSTAVAHGLVAPCDARLPRSIGLAVCLVTSLILWAATLRILGCLGLLGH